MDVSLLGPAFYLVFVVPGFVGVKSYAQLFGHRAQMSGVELTFWSVIWGVLIFGAWQWTLITEHNQALILATLKDPLVAMLTLSTLTFITLVMLKGSIKVVSFLGEAIQDRVGATRSKTSNGEKGKS